MRSLDSICSLLTFTTQHRKPNRSNSTVAYPQCKKIARLRFRNKKSGALAYAVFLTLSWEPVQTQKCHSGRMLIPLLPYLPQQNMTVYILFFPVIVPTVLFILSKIPLPCTALLIYFIFSYLLSQIKIVLSIPDHHNV